MGRSSTPSRGRSCSSPRGRSTGSPRRAKASSGCLRSPSATSTKTTSSAWTMSTAAPDRDKPLVLRSCDLRVSFGSEEKPRREPGGTDPVWDERQRDGPYRTPLLLLFAALLLVLLAVAALLLWRSLGDNLSG